VLRVSELPILAVALRVDVQTLLRGIGGAYSADSAIRDLRREHEELKWKLMDYALARLQVEELTATDADALGAIDPDSMSSALRACTLQSAADDAAAELMTERPLASGSKVNG